jgi:hypothetical protein
MRRDGGHWDNKSPEQIALVARLAASLWRKLGVESSDQEVRLDSEEHRPYYDLDNAGRGLNKGYLDRIGLEAVIGRL